MVESDGSRTMGWGARAAPLFGDPRSRKREKNFIYIFYKSKKHCGLADCVTLKADKRCRARYGAHAVCCFARVSSQATCAILSRNNSVYVARLQFFTILVPLKHRLRNAYDLKKKSKIIYLFFKGVFLWKIKFKSRCSIPYTLNSQPLLRRAQRVNIQGSEASWNALEWLISRNKKWRCAQNRSLLRISTPPEKTNQTNIIAFFY